jgi:N-acetyl-gamma-glutamyl-phosphate reductase
MNRVKVAVLGASGYSGAELAGIIFGHPYAELTFLGAESSAGQKFSDFYPSLKHIQPGVFESVNIEELKGRAQAVFLALPHTKSMEIAPALLEAGLKVIDLSGDFRLKNPAVYEKWYKTKHSAPELLEEAVYGMPEFNSEKIAQARLVANPGCYPTCVDLALWPLVSLGLVEKDTLVVDAKSGVSGAGRKLSATTQFMQVDSDFCAYKAGGVHQHIPEMEQVLSLAAGNEILLGFTPHLLPVKRGILATSTAKLLRVCETEDLIEQYKKIYSNACFVRITGPGELPSLKSVVYTPWCEIGLCVDKRCQRVVVVSCLDNLLKGAASQAVQNFNLMYGFKENSGLEGLSPAV